MADRKKKGVKDVLDAGQQKRDPYTLVAYVSGPVYKIDVSAKSFDEAYATGMRMLNKELDKYKGKVELNKIEVEKWPDIAW
jgi:translation initiation factor 2 alpha subunit (eIF-2alpha)